VDEECSAANMIAVKPPDSHGSSVRGPWNLCRFDPRIPHDRTSTSQLSVSDDQIHQRYEKCDEKRRIDALQYALYVFRLERLEVS
jgi:hypothetical protein